MKGHNHPVPPQAVEVSRDLLAAGLKQSDFQVQTRTRTEKRQRDGDPIISLLDGLERQVAAAETLGLKYVVSLYQRDGATKWVHIRVPTEHEKPGVRVHDLARHLPETIFTESRVRKLR